MSVLPLLLNCLASDSNQNITDRPLRGCEDPGAFENTSIRVALAKCVTSSNDCDCLRVVSRIHVGEDVPNVVAVGVPGIYIDQLGSSHLLHNAHEFFVTIIGDSPCTN